MTLTSDFPPSVVAARSLALELGQGGPDGLSVSGIIAHGQVLTISDGESRLGARANAKPLYVNLGDSKGGSTLGRLTNDYFHSSAAINSNQPLGQIEQAVQVDFNQAGSVASFGGLPFISNSELKPLIQYIERYYDFLNDAAGTNSEGKLNLKTNRFWGDGSTAGNAFSGYQFGDGLTGNIRFYTEYIGQESGRPSTYYSSSRPFVGRQWQSDEYVVQQSSAPGVADGHLIHTWNAEEVNGFKDGWITRDSSRPDIFHTAYLDQISNGVGPETTIYYGYQCWDDEYNGVYVGDAASLGDCTKLVRQPQTAWSPSEASIQLVESHVPLVGAYLYIRTGLRAWVSETGVPLA